VRRVPDIPSPTSETYRDWLAEVISDGRCSRLFSTPAAPPFALDASAPLFPVRLAVAVAAFAQLRRRREVLREHFEAVGVRMPGRQGRAPRRRLASISPRGGHFPRRRIWCGRRGSQ